MLIDILIKGFNSDAYTCKSKCVLEVWHAKLINAWLNHIYTIALVFFPQLIIAAQVCTCICSESGDASSMLVSFNSDHGCFEMFGPFFSLCIDHRDVSRVQTMLGHVFKKDFLFLLTGI